MGAQRNVNCFPTDKITEGRGGLYTETQSQSGNIK